jgi:hypothetical protein
VAVLAGPFITSLDMPGASLTLLALTAEMEALLAAPAAAPGWPSMGAVIRTGPAAPPVPLPCGPDGAGARSHGGVASGVATVPPDQAALQDACVRALCAALQAAAPELNALDAQVRSMRGMCVIHVCYTCVLYMHASSMAPVLQYLSRVLLGDRVLLAEACVALGFRVYHVQIVQDPGQVENAQCLCCWSQITTALAPCHITYLS